MTSEVQTLSANGAFWEETYQLNFQRLCSRACRKLTRGRMAEAEDIVSDTFVKVMLAKENSNEINHPLQYLWKAVQHAWLSQQARREETNTVRLEDLSTKTLEKVPAVKLEPRILETLEREESRQAMMYKFGPMSIAERKMVEMRLDGYSFSEIAAELGEDLKVIRVRWRSMTLRQRTRAMKTRPMPIQS